VYGPSLDAELLVHELVRAQKTDGVSVTSTTISAELRAKLDIAVHRSTVRRWMHALGYLWRNKRYVGGMKPVAKAVRIRQFIIEYAVALSEEEAGGAVVVYTDESFIHTHHALKKGWFHADDRDVIGDTKGKRLILLHAMTENGLLTTSDAVATNWFNEIALTAQVVFDEVLEDGQDDSDYHNTMTGVKFTAWLRNRLLPTFASLYPGKHMYLVLDNASYHKARDETWISASSAQNKHQLVHTLLDLQVTSLTRASGVIVPAHRFETATKKELQAAVQLWLDDHPGHNRTVVEQLMSDAGHTLVYTPPFCPDVQPIELLWAEVKRRVAERSILNRSVTQACEHTEEAFASITWMFCINIVKHVHDWIDGFLKTDAAGDLQQCCNLATVIRHHRLLSIANQTSSATSSTAAPMELDTSAPPAAAATSSSTSATSSGRQLRRRF
jgi:transposase